MNNVAFVFGDEFMQTINVGTFDLGGGTLGDHFLFILARIEVLVKGGAALWAVDVTRDDDRVLVPLFRFFVNSSHDLGRPFSPLFRHRMVLGEPLEGLGLRLPLGQPPSS